MGSLATRSRAVLKTLWAGAVWVSAGMLASFAVWLSRHRTFFASRGRDLLLAAREVFASMRVAPGGRLTRRCPAGGNIRHVGGTKTSLKAPSCHSSTTAPARNLSLIH